MLAKILLFVCVFSLVACKVNVYTSSHTSLREQTQFEMSIANFGLTPYGETVGGAAIFDEWNKDGWKQYPSYFNEYQYPVLIMYRGECTFEQKMNNTKETDIKIVVIIDDSDENIEKMVPYIHPENQTSPIPAVLISKNDGETLMQLLQTADDSNEKLVIKITFETVKTEDIVHVEGWFSLDFMEYEVITKLKSYREQLGEMVSFEPRYYTWSCPEWDPYTASQQCVCGTKYCPKYSESFKLDNGTSLTNEILLEKWIYKHSMQETGSDNLWWEFIKQIVNSNYRGYISSMASRAKSKMSYLDYNKLQKCVNDSFILENGNKVDNEYLREDRLAWKDSHVSTYPSFVINSMVYRGAPDAKNIFKAIWHSFVNPPQICDFEKNLDYEQGYGEKEINDKRMIFTFTKNYTDVEIEREENEYQMELFLSLSIPYGHVLKGPLLYNEAENREWENINKGYRNTTKRPIIIMPTKCDTNSFLKEVEILNPIAFIYVLTNDYTLDKSRFNGINYYNFSDTPAIYIGKRDFDTIKTQVEANNIQFIDTVAYIDFRFPKKSEQVTLELWYGQQQEAIRFIKYFVPFATKLKDQIKFVTKYTSSRIFGSSSDRNWFCRTKYWMGDRYDMQSGQTKWSNDGAFKIMESLRQNCIYESVTQNHESEIIWLNYMREYSILCIHNQTEACSKQVHVITGLNFEESQSWAVSSISGDQYGYDCNITIFDETLKQRSKYRPDYTFPFVVLNGYDYRGKLLDQFSPPK